MRLTVSDLLAAAQLCALSRAAPYVQPRAIEADRINCSNPVKGLTQANCKYISSIGFFDQGDNQHKPNDNINDTIWVGTQGPNEFHFENQAGVDIILIVWHYPIGDYGKMFMSGTAPKVSYSLAKGENVTLSIAHGVSGGWGGIYDHKTILDENNGLLKNTWGEFTTDPEFLRDVEGEDIVVDGEKILNVNGRTHVDVSRLINMDGDEMSIQMDKKEGGCVSDFETCVFECKEEDKVECGRKDEYRLKNCSPGSQKGAMYGLQEGQPEGGCEGSERNGYVKVIM